MVRTYKFPMTFEYSVEDVINVIALFTKEDTDKIREFIDNKEQMEKTRSKARLIQHFPEET